MSTLQIAIIANYALVATCAALLARAHIRLARRLRVPGVLFVGLVLAIEGAEHLITTSAYVVAGHVDPAALALVTVRLSLSWLRLGITWGLLLGARYAGQHVATAHGGRSALRLVWKGYAGGCEDAWCRVRDWLRAQRRGR